MNMRRKPKVALMSYAMDNRRGKGTALYSRKLLEHMLGDEQFEFYLVHYDTVDDPLYKKAQEIIMPRIRLPFATRFVRQMLFFWKYRNDRFDIIHWFQPRMYPFFWFAPAKHLVVTMHGAGDITAPGTFPFSQRVFNFVLRRFNTKIEAIIGVSEFGKNEIIEHYRVAEEKMHAIYNGGGEDFLLIPHEEALRVSGRYGIEGPYILDVARHVEHKNVITLIRAYEKLRREHSERTEKLVVIGGKDSEYEKTKRVIDASEFRHDIILVEYVDAGDLNALYSAAEAFVFPSLNEGFGLPVVEAFASGTPVITSNTSSLPEVAGGAAILIDPLDSAAITEALYTVLSNPTVSQDLVERGLKRAGEFTWKNSAKKTMDLYGTLVRTER